MKKKENTLVENFMMNEVNSYLFELYKNNPDKKEIKKILDVKFKKHCAKIRAISYLTKVIHFESKKFDNYVRKYNERFQIILDKPNSKDEITVLSDLLIDETTIYSFEELPSENIEDYIENPLLHASLKKLTERQKKILYLLFVKNLIDTEIAKKLNVSQQSITKTKNKALMRIRRELND